MANKTRDELVNIYDKFCKEVLAPLPESDKVITGIGLIHETGKLGIQVNCENNLSDAFKIAIGTEYEGVEIQVIENFEPPVAFV